MKKYEVIKELFKQSEQKNYKVGETIDLTKEEAEVLIKEKFVKEIKKANNGLS